MVIEGFGKQTDERNALIYALGPRSGANFEVATQHPPLATHMVNAWA